MPSIRLLIGANRRLHHLEKRHPLLSVSGGAGCDECYQWAMGNGSNGFNIADTRARLEEWCLVHFAWPVGVEFSQWPAARSESVRGLLEIHWQEHGVPVLVERNGVLEPAPRCLESPCPVAGVALAVLEIYWHEVTQCESEEIAWLQQAASRFSLSERASEALLEHARAMSKGLVSRAVETETNGRPALVLANAVARHLKEGGFSYGEVAEFMGASAEATRKRCLGEDRRSLSVFAET